MILASIENAMTAAPAVRVVLRPTRSMMTMSTKVHPIFIVLSMPPANSETRRLRPSAWNRAGKKYFIAVAPHIWPMNCRSADRHSRANKLASVNSEIQVKPEALKEATDRSISSSSVLVSSEL